MLKLATLGHKNVYDDLSYFWLLQKLISNKVDTQKADLLFHQIKLVTRHHPAIESLYSLACFVLALDYSRPELCEPIAQDGIQTFPDNWTLPAIVGYMHAFLLNNPLKAAFYYRKAAEKPKCPPYIAKLSQSLLDHRLGNMDREGTIRAIIEGAEDHDFRDFLMKYFEQHR